MSLKNESLPASSLGVEGLRVASLRIGPEKNFCYLVHGGSEAVLIDGAYEYDRVAQWISSFNDGQLKIKYLDATHGHLDHAGGLNEMKKRFPQAQIAAHEAEKKRLAQAGIDLEVAFRDREALLVDGHSLQVWHTPGHTEGGCCYLTETEVITGDTLFVGQCGRTDMPGGSDELLFGSLQRLKSLPEKTIVRPGHDYGPQPQSTIGHETHTNPTMKVKTLAEFIALP